MQQHLTERRRNHRLRPRRADAAAGVTARLPTVASPSRPSTVSATANRHSQVPATPSRNPAFNASQRPLTAVPTEAAAGSCKPPKQLGATAPFAATSRCLQRPAGRCAAAQVPPTRFPIAAPTLQACQEYHRNLTRGAAAVTCDPVNRQPQQITAQLPSVVSPGDKRSPISAIPIRSLAWP